MAEPVKPSDFPTPFSLEDVNRIKSLFKSPARQGFPTEAELEAAETGLASFLGTTDYDKQLAEDRQLSRLQLGLLLAQRGFGSMGAQRRPGEMAISTVGRELLSPLAGDAGAVATQLLERRRAIQAAQRQEDRQLKLAALQQVQTRQSQEYADDLAATNAAREFLMMAGKKDATVSNDYTVDGINKPVTVRTDRLGNVTFWDTNDKKISGDRIKVYRAPADPTISRSLQKDVYFNYEKLDGTISRARGNVQVIIDDAGDQVLRVVGEAYDVNNTDIVAPGTFALNFEITKDDPSTLYYNAGQKTITVKDAQGRIFRIAPGRFSPVSLKKSVHSSLSREDRSQLREWTETPAGGTVTKEYRNVSGTQQDLSFMGLGIVAPNEKIRITDGEFSLLPSQLKRPEFFAAEPETEVKHNVFTQVYDEKSGNYLNAQPAIRTTQIVNGEPTTRYHVTQQPGGQRVAYSAADAREVVATHHPYKATETLFVTLEGVDKLQDIIPGITAGEAVQVFTASAMSGKGGSDIVEYRYAGEKVQVGAIATGTNLFQTSPLTAAQKKAAGQTVPEEAVTRTNTSTKTITIEGRTIPAGGTVSLTETTFQELDPAIRDVLVKAAPVSLARKSYMVGGNKLIKVEGGAPGRIVRTYAPGEELRGNDAEIAALLEAVPGLKLVTTDKGQGRALRGNWLRNYYKIFLKAEGLTGKDLSDGQVDFLITLFPGNRSLNQEELREQLFKFAGGQPLSRAQKEVVETVGKVDETLGTYQQGVQKRHLGAEARYAELLRKGAVSIPWNQLPYAKREAFATIPIRDRRLLDPETAAAAIREYENALQAEKEHKIAPNAGDISEFATKARVLSILKYMRDNDLLANTGVVKGLFTSLGAKLSDWHVVGSKKAGKLAFMLQQLGANLKQLEAGGARTTNWRLQLIQDTLPDFTTSEFLNTKNMNAAILALSNDMRAQVSPGLQETHVITPQLASIAAEAGVPVGDLDYSKQRWLDPNAVVDPVFRHKDFMTSLGHIRFTAEDFRALGVGRLIPLKDKDCPTCLYLKAPSSPGKFMVIRTTDGTTPAKNAIVMDITEQLLPGETKHDK